MIVGGHVSCGYCSAVIAELEPWPAGERREFVCPECGCVNYATPVVEYRSTTFGRELWRAIVAKVSRRGGTAEFYDDDAASIRLDGTTACMYVRFDGPSSARARRPARQRPGQTGAAGRICRNGAKRGRQGRR